MAKVLSLGKARKARERAAAAAQADRNAILHGRTKAERAQEALERRRRDAAHEGNRREGAAGPEIAAGAPDDVTPATEADPSADAADEPPT